MEDKINHPQHYTSHPSGIECIRITEHMNFNLGNVIKYCWRTEHKNGLEDLKKARWYLEREIARLERRTEAEARPLPKEQRLYQVSTPQDKGQWPIHNFDKEV